MVRQRDRTFTTQRMTLPVITLRNMTELAEELADEGWFGDTRHKLKTISTMPRSVVTSRIEGGFVETLLIYQLLD